MPLSRLRELGSLVSYEEARDAGALRCCDTVQSAVAFAVRHPLVEYENFVALVINK